MMYCSSQKKSCIFPEWHVVNKITTRKVDEQHETNDSTINKKTNDFAYKKMIISSHLLLNEKKTQLYRA